MGINIVDTHGHSLTGIKCRDITRRVKNRVTNIPLFGEPPYSIDRGVETHEIQCVFWIKDTSANGVVIKEFMSFRNPIEVQTSTYHEIESTADYGAPGWLLFPTSTQDKAWYKMEVGQTKRAKGQKYVWEISVTLLRDYWEGT